MTGIGGLIVFPLAVNELRVHMQVSVLTYNDITTHLRFPCYELLAVWCIVQTSIRAMPLIIFCFLLCYSPSSLSLWH
jgi:hypothetical protein